MPAPLMVAAVIGGMQIANGLQNAELIQQGAKLQGRIDDLNVEFAEYDAWQAERFGEEQANLNELNNQQVLGSMNVANAVNDVDASFGTAAALKKEAEFTGFLNTLDIKAQAHAKSLGIKRDALNMRLNAGMRQAQMEGAAADAIASGVIGAASTVGQAYATKYGYKMGKG